MLSRDEERNSSTDFAHYFCDCAVVPVRNSFDEHDQRFKHQSYTGAVCTPKLCENNRVARSVMMKTIGTLVDLQLY